MYSHAKLVDREFQTLSLTDEGSHKYNNWGYALETHRSTRGKLLILTSGVKFLWHSNSSTSNDVGECDGL